MKILTALRRQALTSALCIIAVGLLFVLYPGTALDTLVRLVAAAAFVTGLIRVAGYFFPGNAERPSRVSLVSALVIAGLALFFLIKPQLIVSILYVLIGFALLLDGVLQAQSAMELRRYHAGKWVIVLALAVLTVILAVIILLNPFHTAKTLVLVSGIFLIISGAIDLVCLVFVGNTVPGYGAGRRRR